MKYLVTAIISILTFLSVMGQDPVIKKDVEIIQPFHSISINARYNVHLKQSNEIKVEARALKEVLDATEFEVKEGVLYVNVNKKNDKNKSLWEEIDDIKIAPKLDLYISMKEVKSIQLNGNGTLNTENSIASNELKVSVSGKGRLEADIKGKDLNVSLSGGGLVKLKGYAENADLNVSGYGKVEAFSLELKSLEATLSGSGDAEVNVSENLVATVNGSGSLSHRGDTKKVTKNENGSGKIKRAY